MRVLLVDNSKPDCAIFTPKLERALRDHADVTRAASRTEVVASLEEHHWDAVVLSGSSLNMSQSLSAAALAKDLMVLLRCTDVPILGVCFGMQLMAVAYGGEVARLDEARQGTFELTADGPLASGRIEAFFHHQDAVVEAPPRFAIDAVDAGTQMIVGMHSTELLRYGVQYHPECSTGSAADTLRRFLACAAMQSVRVSGGLTLPASTCDRVALGVARNGVHRTARTHRLSVDVVLYAWTAFRERLHIPAMLI